MCCMPLKNMLRNWAHSCQAWHTGLAITLHASNTFPVFCNSLQFNMCTPKLEHFTLPHIFRPEFPDSGVSFFSVLYTVDSNSGNFFGFFYPGFSGIHANSVEGTPAGLFRNLPGIADCDTSVTLISKKEIIPHLMWIFLGIKDTLVTWPIVHACHGLHNVQKRKLFLIWCGFFLVSMIYQSHDLL